MQVLEVGPISGRARFRLAGRPPSRCGSGRQSKWRSLPLAALCAYVACACLLARAGEVARLYGITPTNMFVRVNEEGDATEDHKWSRKYGDVPFHPVRPGALIETQPQVTAKVVFGRTHEELHLAPDSRFRVPRGDGFAETIKGCFHFLRRSSPEHMNFRSPAVHGGTAKTDFLVRVGPHGDTVVHVLLGEVRLTNALVLQDTLVLTNGEAGFAAGGTNRLQRVPRVELRVRGLAQTFLYSPSVLCLEDLGVDLGAEPTLAESVRAYGEGDLRRALAFYPTNRVAADSAERLYLATLVLSVGDFRQAQSLTVTDPASIEANAARHQKIAAAIQQVMAAAEGRVWARSQPPVLPTEWLAESYYQQARTRQRDHPMAWEAQAYRGARTALERALIAATKATPPGSTFEFGWVRRAELEFSFGRLKKAAEALASAPRHQQGNAQAVALRGFLRWAANDLEGARGCFRQAAALDGRLGNAWLGLGLTELRRETVFEFIRRGQPLESWRPRPGSEGLQHLGASAAAEPDRALLRSYLGKAYYEASGWWGQDAWLVTNACEQLDLAKRLDPNDPTPYLYSALIQQQENRINEGIHDLEQSIELNNNRASYRSDLLLDQDRAVRGANLAAIYRDAGMADWSVQEASRAVNSDYLNASSHLFLANSYDALRDPYQTHLRYETPWLNELLLASLLAPVGSGTLSSLISQQEYSPLFEKDRLGILSTTEYLSRGAWLEAGSQYGRVENLEYALDVNYRSDPGQHPNGDFEQITFWPKLKAQLTPQDSLLFQVIYYEAESGDTAQYYHPAQEASRTLRVHEEQTPDVLLGYHHEWTPDSRTLLLLGWLQDTLALRDPTNAALSIVRDTNGVPYSFEPMPIHLRYDSEFAAFSSEVQHLLRAGPHTLVAGVRCQSGNTETATEAIPVETLYQFRPEDRRQEVEARLERVSVYGYGTRQFGHSLWLTAGLSYDWLCFPANIDAVPIADQVDSASGVGPKLGLRWSPAEGTHFRAAYTRSLGGVSYDASVRLEPSQVAGFNQAFRSLVPESVAGVIPGAAFETLGVAFDQRFPSRTYVGLEASRLASATELLTGAYTASDPFPAFFLYSASATPLDLDYVESSLTVNASQLLGEQLSVGIRYRLTEADCESRYIEIPSSVSANPWNLPPESHAHSVLHTTSIWLNYNHPQGLFGRIEANWYLQNHTGYSPALPGSDFWQFNAHLGYRFPRRRAEIQVGLLNLTDQDYRLAPLNLHSELPRERTIYLSLRLAF